MNKRKGWFLLIPLLLIVAVVSGIPFLKAVLDSFFVDRYGLRSFAGARQYVFVFSDSGLYVSLGVTLVWALLSSLGTIGTAYLLSTAMVLWKRAGKGLYAVLLIPWGLPVFVAGPVWRLIASGGMPFSLDLFGNPAHAFLTCLVISIWMAVPLVSLAMYAAMVKIPRSLVETAMVEGAGKSGIMGLVYRPGIRSTAVAMGIITFIKAFKEFSLLFIMTGGGPPLRFGITGRSIVGSTTTIGVYVYEVFSETEDFGLSSAYVVTISVLILSIVLIWYFVFARGSMIGSGWTLRVKRSFGKRNSGVGILPLLMAVGFTMVSAAALVILIRSSLIPPGLLPGRGISFGNFGEALLYRGVGRSFLNTMILAAAAGILTPAAAFPAAVLARRRSPAIILTLIAVLQILGASTGVYSLVPLYTLSRAVGLVDTYVPVILSSVNQALPFSFIALTAYLRGVPDTLFDEARIAGAGEVRTALSIILPLSMPAVAVVSLYGMVTAWNGFTGSLILLHTENKFPISLKLFEFVGSIGSSGNEWGLFGAAALMNMVILTCLLVMFRRRLAKTGLSDLTD